MKILKILSALLLGIVVVAGALLIVLAKFSSVESRFECTAETNSAIGPDPATVFVKLERFRWWVGLWADSNGAIWIEVPNRQILYYGFVREVGDQLQFSQSQEAMLEGNFSTLSSALRVHSPGALEFVGGCRRTA
jgi:hypothetical protein